LLIDVLFAVRYIHSVQRKVLLPLSQKPATDQSCVINPVYIFSRIHFNIIPRHTIMSLDISFQVFYRLSTRSAAMLSVRSRFLTEQRIVQATVSCPSSLSAVRTVALICPLFHQPNPNTVCRSPFMSSFFCFHCVVHSFFFYIYSTLSYLYFTLICFFLLYSLSFSVIHLVSFYIFLFILFIFLFSLFYELFPFDCQFPLALQSKLRSFFIAFVTNSIRRPTKTPPNVKVVTVLFRHTC